MQWNKNIFGKHVYLKLEYISRFFLIKIYISYEVGGRQIRGRTDVCIQRNEVLTVLYVYCRPNVNRALRCTQRMESTGQQNALNFLTHSLCCWCTSYSERRVKSLMFRVKVVNVIHLLCCFVLPSLFLVLVFIPLPLTTLVRLDEEQLCCWPVCTSFFSLSIKVVLWGKLDPPFRCAEKLHTKFGTKITNFWWYSQ